jgi:hypothetical protein
MDPVMHINMHIESQSPYFEMFMEPRNRFKGMNSASLCSLAARYDNPIPTRFLAPIDCLKITAQMLLSSDRQIVTIPELVPKKDADRMSNKANVGLQAV